MGDAATINVVVTFLPSSCALLYEVFVGGARGPVRTTSKAFTPDI